MSDIVKIYNPANAGSLTPEQLADLQKLTSDQIKELAKAYPNGSTSRPYLLIIDSAKPIGKQLPAASTFENLYNLRVKHGLKKYVAFNFRGNFKPANVQAVRMSRRREVLDLSDSEMVSLPGFRTLTEKVPDGEVKVTKVKKETDNQNT